MQFIKFLLIALFVVSGVQGARRRMVCNAQTCSKCAKLIQHRHESRFSLLCTKILKMNSCCENHNILAIGF